MDNREEGEFLSEVEEQEEWTPPPESVSIDDPEPMPVSVVGLDIDRFVDQIRGSSGQTHWLIADDFGTLYHCGARGRLRRLTNVEGIRRSQTIPEIAADDLWKRFKEEYMYQNQFTVIALYGDARAMLYYCHRLIARVVAGENFILCLGPVSLTNRQFNDGSGIGETNFELQPMRYLRLYGRCFRIRVQSSGHKIFFRSDDYFNHFILFDWIRKYPDQMSIECAESKLHKDSDEDEELLSDLSVTPN